MSLVTDESFIGYYIDAITLRKFHSLYILQYTHTVITLGKMSKKFGINTKSAEAKARKDAVKQANERDKQQKLEDEYWRDDDKNAQKKLQRRVMTLVRFHQFYPLF